MHGRDHRGAVVAAARSVIWAIILAFTLGTAVGWIGRVVMERAE
jgi:NhaP-type Na+/H+ or K+/H+ antiporter